MCTFFVKKPKQAIKKEHFLNIIDNNPQGFGFVYTTGSKLVIVKSSNPNPESMWKKFCDAESKYPQSHFIGHGRIATGSAINNSNTHPFLINQSLSMVHNGILRQFPSTIQKSDTVQYIEQVIKKLPKDFYKNSGIMDMIGRDITGSKFAFLSVDNKVFIVNEHLCVIDGETGVMFSNTNFRKTEWLDYGGTKVSKSYLPTKKSSSYKGLLLNHKPLQNELNFHVDSDCCEIKNDAVNDWEYCQDCHDWVRKHEYSYDWGLCKQCEGEYGLTGVKNEDNYSKTITGKHYGDINYCDDCNVNVASHTHEDWRLCDLCIKSYEDSKPNLKVL
jgi:hypothetical protein